MRQWIDSDRWYHLSEKIDPQSQGLTTRTPWARTGLNLDEGVSGLHGDVRVHGLKARPRVRSGMTREIPVIPGHRGAMSLESMNTVDAWGKRMAMAFASRTGDGHGFRPGRRGDRT